jgi:hypothetical protein
MKIFFLITLSTCFSIIGKFLLEDFPVHLHWIHKASIIIPMLCCGIMIVAFLVSIIEDFCLKAYRRNRK